MTEKGRQPALDLLRVLAAAMVLAVHTGQLAGLDGVTRTGAYGVQLFFILSGYLSEASLARSGDPLRYYKRRAVRILPAYWLLLAVRFVFDTVRGTPCGVRFLRYFVFLQMWLPSEDWNLWNNRSVLWTMSAFAFFYLLAPWLHRLLRGFWPSFAALLALLVCKGKLGALIEGALAGWPAGANIHEFSAKTPVMVLYCFLFGTTLWHALREGKALLYGGFCLLLPVLLDFSRGAPECVLTALVLLALVCPAPALGPRAERGVTFLSGGSFWLYLCHPLVLELLPAGSGWGYFAAAYLLIAAVCYAVYGLAVRRMEGWFAVRFQ